MFYITEELLEIMSLDTPEEYTVGFYKNYLNVLLGVFHFACRSLRELRHLVPICLPSFRVPTQTGKPGKMEKLFPVREKSGNFVQTGKVREIWTKYWKSQGNLENFYFLCYF